VRNRIFLFRLFLISHFDFRLESPPAFLPKRDQGVERVWLNQPATVCNQEAPSLRLELCWPHRVLKSWGVSCLKRWGAGTLSLSGAPGFVPNGSRRRKHRTSCNKYEEFPVEQHRRFNIPQRFTHVNLLHSFASSTDTCFSFFPSADNLSAIHTVLRKPQNPLCVSARGGK
jgi:hypothetical protein